MICPFPLGSRGVAFATFGALGDGTRDEAIDDALTELVSRMEREIAHRGTITAESASELRSLRAGAEQLLIAQTDTALAF